MKEKIYMTAKEWNEEGERLFGEERINWKFVCPVCGFAQGFKDFAEAGIPTDKALGKVGFSCIGRYLPAEKMQEGIFNMNKIPGIPCNYTGGGLLTLNPMIITDEEQKQHNLFDFYRGDE